MRCAPVPLWQIPSFSGNTFTAISVYPSKNTSRPEEHLVVQNLCQDVHYAVRMLLKSPGFAAIAVLTLALGIGANTAIFSIANVFLFRPLPVKDADRLVAIGVQSSLTSDPDTASYLDFLDYKQSPVFTDMTAFVLDLVGIGYNGRADRTILCEVPSNFFTMLGIHPAVGRLILPGEGDQPRTGNILVLGYSYWRRRFGGDPGIVGRSVTFDGHEVTVVGVAEKRFHGPYSIVEMDAYAPIGMQAYANKGDAGLFTSRGQRVMHPLAILKPGVTTQEAEVALQVIATRLSEQFPQTDHGQVVRVFPERIARPDVGSAKTLPLIATVFLTLVGLVLMVACINVANLLLARSASRQKEIAVRASMGATRFRLIRQMLTESILLAVVGGAAGALLGMWTCSALERLRPLGDFPLRFGFTFDWRVFGYVAAVATAAGILAGLAPALRASRTNLNETLRESGRGLIGEGGRRHILRNSLVVAQIAGSIIVLVSAGLFVRSLRNAESVDLGYDPHNMLNLCLNPDLVNYDRPRGEAFYRELLRRVKALPGVESASFAYSVPLSYYSAGGAVQVEGQVLGKDERAPGAQRNMVGPEYFDNMRMKIVSGHAFTDADTATSPLVAIINQTMAKRLWPNQDPIGRRFSYDGGEKPGELVTVVGVVRNAKVSDVVDEPGRFFYVPITQNYNATHVLQLRTSVPPETLVLPVEAQIHELDANMPVFDVMTMEKSLMGGNGFFLYQMGAAFAGTLGGLGLLLAVVGVYGVVSQSAASRTHEIGIRMALGAHPRNVFTLVLGQAAVLVGVGIIVGLVVALGATHVIASLLVGVTSSDPLTFTTVALLLLLAAFVACYLPAHHAMRVDPMEALRYE
jgi:predicted permease